MMRGVMRPMTGNGGGKSGSGAYLGSAEVYKGGEAALSRGGEG